MELPFGGDGEVWMFCNDKTSSNGLGGDMHLQGRYGVSRVLGLWFVVLAQTGVAATDITAGKKLFETKLCKTCHSLEEGKTIVGPSLAHIASRGDQNFFMNQLKDPQANFKNTSVSKSGKSLVSLMPKPALTEKERQDLINYLLTIK